MIKYEYNFTIRAPLAAASPRHTILCYTPAGSTLHAGIWPCRGSSHGSIGHNLCHRSPQAASPSGRLLRSRPCRPTGAPCWLGMNTCHKPRRDFEICVIPLRGTIWEGPLSVRYRPVIGPLSSEMAVARRKPVIGPLSRKSFNLFKISASGEIQLRMP